MKSKPAISFFMGVVMTIFFLVLGKGIAAKTIPINKIPIKKTSIALQQKISGTVKDAATGDVLPGVTILVKGTSNGIVTDVNGNYSIEVESSQDTLQVSYTGYETQLIPIKGRTTINILLKSSIQMLDQLVVTGMGITSKKKSLGQSISTVDASSFKNAPVSTVNQALAGRVPGLVNKSAGEPGAASPIRLRGTISLTQRNGPLIYIDGVRMDNTPTQAGSLTISPLARINPEAIERIVVLKGAAAAALYGTEASAGVIQIFTKSGINLGKPIEVTFKTAQKFNRVPLNRISKSVVYDKDNDQFLSVFPPKYFFKTGHDQIYNLTIRGGTSKYGYFVSGRYRDLNGSLPTTGLGDLDLNTKVSARPIDGMNIQVRLNAVDHKVKIPYPTWGLMGEFVLDDPLIKNEQRPYGELYHTIPGILAFDNIQNNRSVNMSALMNYQFTKTFKLHFLVGHITHNQRTQIYVPPGPDVPNPTGFRDITNTRSSQTSVELTLNANTQISKRLGAITTVGAQSFWHKSRDYHASVKDFPTSVVQVLNGATTITGLDEFFKEVISAGVFAQEQLSLNNNVFLTGGIRLDGNSTFGDNFGFQAYPHVGLSWTLSEEPFWNSSVVSKLRIRSSYGVSGEQPGVYDKLRTWSILSLLGGKPVVVPYSYGNQDLKPERSKEIEIGANVGFFDNKLTLDLTYYNQHTVDAILARKRAPSNGYLEPQLVNIGGLRGQGIEVGANLLVVDNAKVQWSMFATFSKRKQIVEDLGGIPGFKVGGDSRRWNYIEEGYQPGAEIGPVLDADNPYTLAVPVSEFNDLSQLTPNYLLDKNGEPVRKFLGNQLPTETGSFGSTLNLKKYNLSISALLTGESGFVMHNETEEVRVASQLTPYTAVWIRDLSNPNTSVERRQEIANEYIKHYPNTIQDWLSDGKYFELQEASISWNLPGTLTSKIRAENATITIAGRNLFIISGYEGIINPGTSSSGIGDNDFATNVEYFGAPTPRQFEISLRVTF